MTDRILVTGGAGFIGANTTRALLQEGHDVRVIDDFSTGLASNLRHLEVEVIEASICDVSSVKAAAQRVDKIVHLAARGSVPRSIAEPVPTHDVNSFGTLNVLEAARDNDAQVLLASSSSVYGNNSALPKNEDMWVCPMSPYAASKLAAEGYCAAYSAAYGIPVTVFRFFNIFGPWQRADHDYAAVIPRWIWAALHGMPISLDGDGSQTRDFTFVSSVVDVLLDALKTELDHPRAINLAFGNRISLQEVLSHLEQELGVSLAVERRPSRPADIPHSQNDPSLVQKLFPNVEPVPFREAISETIQWMSTQRAKTP